MELHTFPKLAKLSVDGITSTDIYGLVSHLLNEKSYDTAKRVRQGIINRNGAVRKERIPER